MSNTAIHMPLHMGNKIVALCHPTDGKEDSRDFFPSKEAFVENKLDAHRCKNCLKKLSKVTNTA